MTHQRSRPPQITAFYTLEFTWKAPAESVGNITFWLATISVYLYWRRLEDGSKSFYYCRWTPFCLQKGGHHLWLHTFNFSILSERNSFKPYFLRFRGTFCDCQWPCIGPTTATSDTAWLWGNTECWLYLTLLQNKSREKSVPDNNSVFWHLTSGKDRKMWLRTITSLYNWRLCQGAFDDGSRSRPKPSAA